MGKILAVIVVGLLATVHTLYLQERDRCTSDNDLCSDIESCTELVEPIKKGFRPKICSFNGSREIICCSTQVEQELDFREDWHYKNSVSEKMCLSYLDQICASFIQFVIGGDPAHAKELPFMALIGYGSRGDIEWYCGGTLISHNFVLSAAHCTTPATGQEATWVKLGDLDISTEKDDAKPQVVRIVERIDHPDYKAALNYHDIALYRLQKNVEFNDYIRPICLYNSESLDRHKTVIAAGWGKTEKGKTSEKLLRVNLELFNMSSCGRYAVESKEKLPDGLKTQSQICSGRTEGGGDTCDGDSGGPLFLPSINRERGLCVLYTQIGITSFGPRLCGQKGDPGVYTRISAYREWIEQIVWNDTQKKPIWT